MDFDEYKQAILNQWAVCNAKATVLMHHFDDI